DRFPIHIFLHGDMSHARAWRSAMPMFLTRRNRDDVTLVNFLDLTAPLLDPAGARGHDQGLAQRVNVPVGAGAGLEGDAGARGAGWNVGREQRIDARGTGEVFGGCDGGRLLAASRDGDGLRILGWTDRIGGSAGLIGMSGFPSEK